MVGVFGLRGFHGRFFRIATEKCYGNQVVVQVKDGEMWIDFSRGTRGELEKEMVKLYNVCAQCTCEIPPSVYGICKDCFKEIQAAE